MKILPAIALAVMLAGCAATPAPINPAVQAQMETLKTEKIAVGYHLVAKRINYSEVLYRVLWLENTSAAQDFSGLWSADEDLTNYVVGRIKAQGFKAESVYSLAKADTVNAYMRSTALKAGNNSTYLRSGAAPGSPIPPAMFFEETLRTPEFTALAGELQAQGYRYLAEFTGMDIAAAAPGLGMVVVGATPNLRIIDLKNGKVFWSQNLTHTESYQLGGDLKKLEENGMSKTKEALKAGIERFDFINLWGLGPVTAR